MTPEVRADWGRRVRSRRKGLLTQEQLAERSGVSQSAISKLEKGELNITDDLKWRIAGALGTTVDTLFPNPAVRPPAPMSMTALMTLLVMLFTAVLAGSAIRVTELTRGVYTVAEAAARLGVREETAHRWIREGTFPVPLLKVGARRRVSIAVLERYLEGEAS